MRKRRQGYFIRETLTILQSFRSNCRSSQQSNIDTHGSNTSKVYITSSRYVSPLVCIRCCQVSKSCYSGVHAWTRGGIVVPVLRTATVCIGTVVEEPSVPVSVMRFAAVCYSIIETYDNDRLHCTKRVCPWPLQYRDRARKHARRVMLISPFISVCSRRASDSGCQFNSLIVRRRRKADILGFPRSVWSGRSFYSTFFSNLVLEFRAHHHYSNL